MKCKYYIGKGTGCGQYGPENCVGHDLGCNVIEEPKPPNPIPAFVYDELKAQNASLISELRNMLHLFDRALSTGSIGDYACKSARAVIDAVEAKP